MFFNQSSPHSGVVNEVARKMPTWNQAELYVYESLKLCLLAKSQTIQQPQATISIQEMCVHGL